MTFTIVGAGAIGSAITRFLLEQDDVDEVRVCDARSRSLQTLRRQISSKKLRPFQVDGRDPAVLRPIVEGSQCLIGCADSRLNPTLARVALETGTHFCDQGDTAANGREVLELGEQAAHRGVWLIPNGGLAPGLVNILCLHGVDQFDEVDNAFIRVGDVPINPEPPFNFKISSTAQKIIDDYTRPTTLVEDGLMQVVQPLTRVEHLFFEEPFGLVEAFASAVNVDNLVAHLEGRVRNLDLKTISWPGHAEQMSFVLGLGFGENRKIDIQTHLTYRDVLIRRMTERMSGDHQDAVLVRIVVNGRTDGALRTLVIEMVDHFDGERGLSAMQRSSSLPTVHIARLLASGALEGGGAQVPELAIPREPFLEAVRASGLAIETRWYDGHRSVTDPTDSADVAPAHAAP